MTTETQTYSEASPDPASLAITPEQVARLAKAGPPERCSDALATAIAEARTLIAPRARWVTVDADTLPTLFADPTPVAGVAAAGRHAWAFVVTIGPALEARVREHMEANCFLEGLLLDAAGSTAAEAVADSVELRCAGELASTRFSPGYCSWSMASQPGLFATLEPGDLGITLLESFLMEPLKSVSGLVVSGNAEDLVIPKEACADCDARGCSRRQAAPAQMADEHLSIRDEEAPGPPS